MTKWIFFVLPAILCRCTIFPSLTKWDSNRVNDADFSLGITDTQTNVSLGYHHDWRLDIALEPNRYRKLELGFGAKFTSSFGGDSYFTSVLPMVENPSYQNGTYQSKYIPDPDPTHSDSVHFSYTQVNALNFMVHVGYFFSDRLSMGVNWDIIGLGFGGARSGTYINGAVSQPVTASPERFNYLFSGKKGEQQQGALFSEFYLAYDIGRNWSLKWGLTHSSSQEFLTSTMVQSYPEPNNRFRSQAIGGTLGVTYQFPDKKIQPRKRRRGT